MTSKTKTKYNYVSIRRKVGMKKDKAGNWVTDYRRFYGATKTEAEAKYYKFLEARSVPDLADKPLGYALDQWLTTVFEKDHKLKPRTKQIYKDAYTRNMQQLDICNIPLKDVNAMQLQAAINSLECAPATVHQLVKLLKRFYKYAAANGLINYDPSVSLVLPEIKHKRTNQRITVWSDDEIKLIITALDSYYMHYGQDYRLRLFIHMALNTGMRCGELLGLKYDDIRNDTIFVSRQLIETPQGLILADTKTSASVRSIPISDDLLKEIERHQIWHYSEMLHNGYSSDMVFTTSKGNYVDAHNVRTSLMRLYKRYNIPAKNIHVYRHTFASRLAAAGVELHTVAALLGHDNVSTTAKYYVDVADKAKKQAITALKLY